MAASVSVLLAKVRRELGREGDAARALAMKAYMKSAMPYHGVPTPQLRAVCKRVFAAHEIASAKAWERDVLALWRGARFREERYAALALTSDRRFRAYETTAALPMYEEMVVDGAWWDFIDPIATHHLSAILVSEPAKMRRTMLAWSRDENMWKRRCSILCQIPFKTKTDLELLYTCIEPSLASREFFLRKAIGWALRQYAWTDAAEVQRFVAQNRARLSPLSVREALKNVGAGDAGDATSSPARGALRRSGSGARRTPSRARPR
jgi:3-methyladenine DNA glycosylase AlkD